MNKRLFPGRQSVRAGGVRLDLRKLALELGHPHAGTVETADRHRILGCDIAFRLLSRFDRSAFFVSFFCSLFRRLFFFFRLRFGLLLFGIVGSLGNLRELNLRMQSPPKGDEADTA